MTPKSASEETSRPATSSRDGIRLGSEHPVLALDERTVQVGVGPRALRLTGDRGRIEETLSLLRDGAAASSFGPLAGQLLAHGLAEPVDAQEQTLARLRLATVVVEGLGTLRSTDGAAPRRWRNRHYAAARRPPGPI